MDALFVMAAVDRPVRFVMSEYYYNRWYLHPLAKLMEAIPVSSTASPKLLLQSLRTAGEALDQGDVVCIFPEGQITHTGKILPFKRGLEVITKGRSCPIVPIHLDHVWGSIFSFSKGKFLKKWPQQFPYSVTLSIGEALPAETPSTELRKAVQRMECEAWMARKEEEPPIHHQFIRNIRRRPFRLTLADKDRTLSGWKTLAGAIAIAKKIKWEPTVGILLPTSIPAVLVNIGATLSGSTVVNLNFTAGREAMESAIVQAELKTVITSQLVLDKLGYELPGVKMILIEDLIRQISPLQRFWAACIALFAPLPYFSNERPLTVIFTSGSTGQPKGVVLSHFNISSNVDAVSQVIAHMGKKRNLLASLPLFHSFGYMLMWLGLNHRWGLVTHPNPLDCKTIGELVKRYEVKLMMSTPTFLRGYIKQVLPAQFGSLECVLTGAEKLPGRTLQAFETQFGIRPIEGYGATECSPVIATSTLNVRLAGIYQVGTLQGSVGEPLPGVIVKVVDPDSFQELPEATPGLLLIKGPNVMEGYLNRDDLTSQIMKDGWYITGDMAQIDSNGFITITDRLRRISKIGGEMVPHGRVEEALHEAAETDEQLFAVTALPDEVKGERLIVLHTYEEEKLAVLLKRVSEKGLSNLYLPRQDQFIKVEQIPVLASGKLDLQKMKQMASIGTDPQA